MDGSHSPQPPHYFIMSCMKVAPLFEFSVIISDEMKRFPVTGL